MTKQTLFYLLILSFFSCQKEVKFYATNAAQIPAGITQEIPSKLLCGYNELRTKAINDSIIEYRLDIFKGWHNKRKIKTGRATRFYPEIVDTKNRNLNWISYRSIDKKETIIASFGYNSAGIFVSGIFSVKSKIEPFECNDFWKK